MSVESMAIVLHHSRARGTAKLVLIGIANHDGDGGAWPSQETLAKYANVDVRNVRKAVEALVKAGEIRVVERGGLRGDVKSPRHQSNRYEVLVRCPADCDRSTNHRTPDRMKASAQECEDDNIRTLVSDRTKSSSGDRMDSSSGDRMQASPEPSVEPSVEPSIGAELALVPAAGLLEAKPETAQTVLADYIDWCREKRNQEVPSKVRGHLAREIKTLLTDGFDDRQIKIGLAEMNRKGANPAALASFVQHATATPGLTRTEERVQAGLAVAARMAAAEGVR